MRFLLAGLVCVLLPAMAAAHGDSVAHVNPVRLELSEGETREFVIEFEEGSLRKDWVFLLNVAASDGVGPVNITLMDPQGTVAAWAVPANGETQYATTRIRETGEHRLLVRNDGTGAVRADFFYDASCNCAGKPIPPDVPMGAVLFNVDASAGDHLETLIPEPALLDLFVVHAIRTNESSRWPMDFLQIETSPMAIRRDGQDVHRFVWSALDDERHYFWVVALHTDRERFDRQSRDAAVMGVYVEPSTGPAQPEGGNAPSSAGGILVAVVVGAAWVRRRC
jgi:hypothetical protein